MQFNVDLQSEHKDLFLEVRDYLLNKAGFQETQKVRITTYSDENGGICHLRTMPYGIDIGFLKGAKFQDELGLLTGKGKAMRVLPLQEINEDALIYYLEQAVAINKKKK